MISKEKEKRKTMKRFGTNHLSYTSGD